MSAENYLVKRLREVIVESGGFLDDVAEATIDMLAEHVVDHSESDVSSRAS